MTRVIGQSSSGTRGHGRQELDRGRREVSRRLRPGVLRRWSALFPLGLLAQGCPVYEDYCDSPSDCAPGFRCNAYTGDCELASIGPGPACGAPGDCGPGETCAESGECRPGSCVFHGCVSGYTCSVVDGLHACSLGSSGGGPGAIDAGAPDASVGDAAPAPPSDAAADGPPLDGSTADATP
jgi:hypothetical protein